MKKFTSHLGHNEIVALCKRKRWQLDTSRYDNGSDWITFQWKWGTAIIPVIYSSCNGRFMVQEGECIYTERSEDGCTPWYDALLNTLFTNKPQEQAA